MISFDCAVFIRLGGIINCKVEGNQRYSSDLPQGGMEIPCKLIFKGPLKVLQKVQKYFDSALGIQVHIQNSNSDSVVYETISVSSSSDATSLDTTIKYPQPEKRALDTVSAECSKEKRIKCVTVDNSDSNIIINTKGVWVQFRCNTLMMEDKYIIENSL